jgi:hypothetical protein
LKTRAQYNKYNIHSIQQKARYLVEEGFVGRHQPIYALSIYMNFCEWAFVERKLKESNFQIGDRISNLIEV